MLFDDWYLQSIWMPSSIMAHVVTHVQLVRIRRFNCEQYINSWKHKTLQQQSSEIMSQSCMFPSLHVGSESHLAPSFWTLTVVDSLSLSALQVWTVSDILESNCLQKQLFCCSVSVWVGQQASLPRWCLPVWFSVFKANLWYNLFLKIGTVLHVLFDPNHF